MSTRGLIGYRLANRDYVQYNHSDSYPTWLGKRIIAYTRTVEVPRAKAQVQALRVVDESKKPTLAQLKKAYPFVKDGEETFDDMLARFDKPGGRGAPSLVWHELLREFQGDLRAWDSGLPFWPDCDGFQFSTSCEWAYILNLDTEVLEIYTGHWRAPGEAGYGAPYKPAGRYAQSRDETGRRGILLIDEIPFAQLQGLSDAAVARYCERLNNQY